MAHEIANSWTSYFNAAFDGTFDLKNLHDDGKNLQDCSHINPRLGGIVDRINPFNVANPHFYLVKINEIVDQSLLQYRGVAIFNPGANRFDRIIGVRIAKDITFSPARLDLLNVQDTLTFLFA